MSISLIVASEFDINLGPQIKQQYPATSPSLKDQLPFLSEIVIPDQLHNKSVDKEDFTLFPIYQDFETKLYKYTKTNPQDEQLILFTVCNYKYDSTKNRNYSIKSLSIITKLPIIISLKPIMIMLLENYFHNEDFESIRKFFDEINKYPLLELFQMRNLDSLQRVCYLEYLKKNEFNNELDKFEIVFGSNYSKLLVDYKQNKDNIELTIPIELQKGLSLKIPLRISIYSILGSSLQFFGYNLEHDNVLKNLINTVNGLELYNKSCTPFNRDLFPFEMNTPMLIVLINAVLTGKKVIVLSYTKSIMNIIEFILALLILLHDENDPKILRFNTFPYFDVSKMDLIKGMSNYILGTTNPIFKEITNEDGDKIWDLLIDLDTNEIIVQQQLETKTDSNTIATNNNTERKKSTSSLFSKNMKFPSFKKKRNSVNSVESSSSKSLMIDDYFKDDYSVNNELETDAEADTGFKFEFEKTLLLYGNNADKEIDQDFIMDKIQSLNKLVANRQDDILIYIFFVKEIILLGYDLIFKNLKLGYNLNKLINYRTFRYEMEFKGLTARDDMINASINFEKSVISLNNEELIIPYNFNIFQFGETDKEILEYYNSESTKFFNFIRLFTNFDNNKIDVSPELFEHDLRYSVNVLFYIHKMFKIFANLNAVSLQELEIFLQKFRTVLYYNKRDELIHFFYYLISITKRVKFGNLVQDLSFIQILIIMQKFIKTSDDCNLEINRILYKFKEDWYCSKRIDELINDFID